MNNSQIKNIMIDTYLIKGRSILSPNTIGKLAYSDLFKLFSIKIVNHIYNNDL